MKILYLFSTAESSVAIVTLNQVKALRKYYPELNIKIACVNYYKERSVLDGEIDYKKDYNSNQIINYIQSLKFVRRVKNDFKPDITISNMSSINSYNALINNGDIKVGIFHAPNRQLNNRNFLTKLWHRISLKYFFSRLDTIVGISNEIVCDFVNQNINVDIQLFYNIHNIDKIKEKSVEIIDKNFIHKNSIEFLCLGTIDYNKRQDLILKVLLQNPNKNIKLYIVGKVMELEYYRSLQRYIKKNKLEDMIIFIPFLGNPYPLIKRVDALLSLSQSEGLPGVIIEALILNTPVVSTNSSQGVWEILGESHRYNSNFKEIINAKKGLILPNPIVINEDDLIKKLNQAINSIILNNQSFKEENFTFLNSISEISIHKFYSFLENKINGNNN